MAAAVTPPLNLGEILDRTVQLYRRNFLLFVGISVAPAACYVLVGGSTSLYITSHATDLQGAPSTPMLFTLLGVVAAFLVLGMPLLTAVSSLALSALTYAAGQRNHQQPITVRAAYGYAFKNFWRYLGILALQFLFTLILPFTVFSGLIVIGAVSAALVTSAAGNPVIAVLAGILIVLLSITVFVVMVLIWLRLCLAFPASMGEGLKVWPSIQRSNRLTKGSRGRIFVMYLLVVILMGVVYYALLAPVDLVLFLVFFRKNELALMFTKPPLILQVVNLFIGFIQRALAIPVYAIALVLFYNDQRTRQEGYDIELLMAQAGWNTQPPPIAATPAPDVSGTAVVEILPSPAGDGAEGAGAFRPLNTALEMEGASAPGSPYQQHNPQSEPTNPGVPGLEPKTTFTPPEQTSSGNIETATLEDPKA